MAIRSPTINVMVRAVQRAARDLKRDFGEVEQLQISRKGPGDFVSAADLQSEQVLHQELQEGAAGLRLPHGRERRVAGSDPEHRWLIDPLDGTTNFLHGIPHFSISLALEAPASWSPAWSTIRSRTRCSGPRRGSAPISTTAASASPRGATSRMRCWSRASRRGSGAKTPIAPRSSRQFDAALAATAGVRRLGSAALDLAYVAAGRYEGFWENHLSPWDIAAGIVLVREAGGYVTEIDGGADMLATGSTFAANAPSARRVGKLLRTATAGTVPVRDKRVVACVRVPGGCRVPAAGLSVAP